MGSCHKKSTRSGGGDALIPAEPIAALLADIAPIGSPRTPPPPVAAVRDAVPKGPIPRRQLLLLSLYTVVIWSLGNGLLPLLPKFATGLGASDVDIGYFLALSYGAIALGSASAGWLSGRLGRIRVQMVVMALVVSPLFLLTSQVTAFWQLLAVSVVLWWFGGVSLTLATIVAGLSAGPRERGTVLGILALTAPLGSILGGLGIGYLADSLGFSAMWIVVGLIWLLCPAAGLFIRDVAPGARDATIPGRRGSGLWRMAFLVLLASAVLGAFGSFIGGFGRSLVMRSGFTNEDITSTVAVSGLATLPFPLLLGYLSDRFGRLRFLGLCYLVGVVGLLVYSAASQLVEFWMGSAFVAFVAYVSTGVGSALVTDIVDRPSLSRGLALFNTTGWIGGILGFAIGGVLFAYLGYADGFRVGAALLVAAFLLLVPIARSIGARRPALS